MNYLALRDDTFSGDPNISLSRSSAPLLAHTNSPTALSLRKVAGCATSLCCCTIALVILTVSLVISLTPSLVNYEDGNCLITKCRFTGSENTCENCILSYYILHYQSEWGTTGKYHWITNGENNGWCNDMINTNITCYRYKSYGRHRVIVTKNYSHQLWYIIAGFVGAACSACLSFVFFTWSRD